MTRPYEFISADRGGFTGWTFGCNCCVESKELREADVLEALHQTGQMYQELADRYSKMYLLVVLHGSEAVCNALGKYEVLKRSLLACQAAREHLDTPGSAGEFGEESAAIGLDTLLYRAFVAQAEISTCEVEIIHAFLRGR
jgi:hypothetical protein